MLGQLAGILAQARPEIQGWLRQLPSLSPQEVCRQAIEKLPDRMKKV